MNPYYFYLANGGTLPETNYKLAINLFFKFIKNAINATLLGESLELDVIGFKVTTDTKRKLRWHKLLTVEQEEVLKNTELNLTVLQRDTCTIASINGNRITYPSPYIPPAELKYLWLLRKQLTPHFIAGTWHKWLLHIPVTFIDEVTFAHTVSTVNEYANLHKFNKDKCLDVLTHNIKLIHTKTKTFPRSIYDSYPIPCQLMDKTNNLIFSTKREEPVYTKHGRFRSQVTYNKWIGLRLV